MRAVDLLLRQVRLVPEDGSAADVRHRVDPFAGEGAERVAVQAHAHGIHGAVGIDLMGLRVIGQKMGLVAGRAGQPPVVHPGLQADLVGDLQNLLHLVLVPVPVGVRKHVHHEIHSAAHHVAHILAGVMGHAVAVVRGAELQGLGVHEQRPP